MSISPDLVARFRRGLSNYGGSGKHTFRLLSAAEFRAVVDSSNSVADLARFTDWNLAPAKGGRIAPRLTIIPSSTLTVAVSTESSRTEAAAPTPYGTALPEGSISFTDSDEAEKRVGVWVPVTKGAWEDEGAVQPMVRTLLEDDLLRVLDAQLLTGDGLGENLDGILTATLPAQPLGTDTRPMALARACSTIRNASHAGPIDVVANATDLLEASLEADFRDVLEVLRAVWGVRDFVAASSVPSGTILVGDFAAGAHLYLRDDVTVDVSDAHSTFFVEGKVAVAAETRVSSRVVQTSAFVEITGA